jgi:hypothetical protein
VRRAPKRLIALLVLLLAVALAPATAQAQEGQPPEPAPTCEFPAEGYSMRPGTSTWFQVWEHCTLSWWWSYELVEGSEVNLSSVSLMWGSAWVQATGEAGQASFAFRFRDPEGRETAPYTVLISVDPSHNSPPDCTWAEASGDVRLGRHKAFEFSCWDPDHDPIHFTTLEPPVHGSVTDPARRPGDAPNGARSTYTAPAEAPEGVEVPFEDPWRIQATDQPPTDAAPLSDAFAVRPTVRAADHNSPPTCMVYATTVYRDTESQLSLSCADAEDEGPVWVDYDATTEQGGSVTGPFANIFGDRTLRYKPPAGYTGPDSFTLTPKDSDGLAGATLSVDLIVSEIPPPACWPASELQVRAGGSRTFHPTCWSNAGEPLEYEFREPSLGSLQWNPTSTHATYTAPLSDSDGNTSFTDAFEFRAISASGASDWRTQAVRVDPDANEGPHCNVSVMPGVLRVGQSGDFLVECADPDGDPVSLEGVDAPQRGTLSNFRSEFDGATAHFAGTFTADESGGTAGVTIRVVDDRGAEGTGWVTFKVPLEGATTPPYCSAETEPGPRAGEQHTFVVHCLDQEGDPILLDVSDDPEDTVGGTVESVTPIDSPLATWHVVFDAGPDAGPGLLTLLVREQLPGAEPSEPRRRELRFLVRPGAPAPPDTEIESGPADPTNATTATFTFGSPGNSDATFECRELAPGAAEPSSWEPCASGDTRTGYTAEGRHELQVRAVVSGTPDPTPASWAWTVDLTPPAAYITSGPGGASSLAQVTFSFTASEPGSVFLCAPGAGELEPCTSPHQVAAALGENTFRVVAEDAAGNRSDPATRTWTRVTEPTAPTTVGEVPPGGGTVATPPPSPEGPVALELTVPASAGGGTVTIAPAPDPAAPGYSVLGLALDISAPAATAEDPLVFRFTLAAGALGQADPAEVQMMRDGTPITAGCEGPAAADPDPCEASRTTLSDGSLQIVVRSSRASRWAFVAAEQTAVEPDTRILSGPDAETTRTTARFRLASDPAELRFECSLDDAPFTPCGPSVNYNRLALGTHTFRARAVDAAGTVDPSPAEWAWSVVSKTKKPKP